MSRTFRRRLATAGTVLRLLPFYLAACVLKHVVPLGALVRWAWRSPGPQRDRAAERRLTAAADVIRRLTPFRDGDCLQRSLVLYRGLSGAGADPVLAVGFRAGQGGLAGHAWVVVDGRALGPDLGFPPAVRFGRNGRRDAAGG